MLTGRNRFQNISTQEVRIQKMINTALMIFLLSFAAFLIIVSAMSVGVMAGRKPISGSCGGLNNLGVEATCEFCGGDPGKCKSAEHEVSITAGGEAMGTAYYDAATS